MTQETLQEQENRSIKRIIEIAKANAREGKYVLYTKQEEREIERLCKALLDRTCSVTHLKTIFRRVEAEEKNTEGYLEKICDHIIFLESCDVIFF